MFTMLYGLFMIIVPNLNSCHRDENIDLFEKDKN